MKTNRTVRHKALVALDGATVRIETVRNEQNGETAVFLHDPNTGAVVASLVFADGGAHNAHQVAHIGMLCSARKQSASYRD